MSFKKLAKAVLNINGREYQAADSLRSSPVVVVCMDGFDPDYLQAAESRGIVPNLAKMKKNGFFTKVHCTIPSFTNPNNVSIITGVPPSKHGICGNFFLDPRNKSQVMMNDSSFMTCEHTILSSFRLAGFKVGAVTAKNKLLSLLSHNLEFNKSLENDPICFSAEGADNVSVKKNGLEGIARVLGKAPDVYSAECSLYVLKSGVYLQSKPELRRDLLYLSTTDYIYHKDGPEEQGALDYINQMDREIGKLMDLGCVVGVTADHGMSQKGKGIIFLEQKLPASCTVILPITDPYVKHHASLGSFALVYVGREDDAGRIAEELRKIEGVELVLPGDEAAQRFNLPRERIGDLAVISKKEYVVGTAPEKHNLGVLDKPLRSHGGLTEQTIPFLLSRRLIEGQAKPNHNYDIFHSLLN